MKRISVIVPVYNVEKYLGKCLYSLVNQTLGDFEIIVVNDGSTDGSQQIIDDYAKDFPLIIKAFKKKNGGLSSARNLGLDHARGEYIGFVDSDDKVSATMFENLYMLARKYDAEIALCDLQKVDENDKVRQKLPQIPNLPEKVILAEDFSLFADISYFACNKIFKKSLFEQRRFKCGVHFEDIQLIPQLILDSEVIAHSSRYHYQYLERSDSISKTYTEKGLDILRAVNEVEDVFRNSRYRNHAGIFKDFQILEGVYSFLAYLAFVKDDEVYKKMSAELKVFLKAKDISLAEILRYKRFGRNYLLSLSVKKKIYYLLYFLGQEDLMRKLI
ncbi:glycosyltransferase [Kaistella palustris]|uniref:glycosyltransferase n=1 Tax=Kaistella palustris TaxID=493376 RepID=UPI0003FA9414|nr:glycosyltransferase [Kaistella palustris]